MAIHFFVSAVITDRGRPRPLAQKESRKIGVGLDTDQRNPASQFLLHVLGAAAEFERH
jgi:hypothetical protein